jgi:hypothetical protein
MPERPLRVAQHDLAGAEGDDPAGFAVPDLEALDHVLVAATVLPLRSRSVVLPVSPSRFSSCFDGVLVVDAALRELHRSS